MGADIKDWLEESAGLGWQGDMCERLRGAAAEIGRLRGEVEALGMQLSDEVLIAKRAAPAMPNGVEAADVHLAAEMLTWGREEGLTVKQEAEVAAHAEKLFRLLRASDNRDAAGVLPAWIATWMADREILPDDDGDGISEGALVEALNNHERELLNAIPKAPAAVPAGEAVAINYAVVHRFATEHGVDYNRLAKLVRDSVYTTPPAPVQAAQQEVDGDKALGKRVRELIATATEEEWGNSYFITKVTEAAAANPPAANHSACEPGADEWKQLVMDEVSANLAFRAAGGARPDEDMPTFCARLISERNAVRQIIENWRHDAEIEAAISRLDRNALRACADELDAALQHRGDSQEVGRV